ncbi:CDP-glycerol glycerophosphotransferase family protein [Paenibacillus sp. J5C2022]|uniref:CDP-glycerol glycerophosphotransferase family protein n=1 Tax=Paenibacillus sp. J5C2022 TaxID=2977129 RepID=UPI0021CE01FC|nr:CDP-glycerol glycerophosphotransferase family protein [Paenibacillus sp. J5C2022]
MIIKIYKIINHFMSVKKSVIIFESNVGKSYTGNPKYIYEELVRQNLDKKYKCVWVFENPKDKNLKTVGTCKKIKRLRIRYFYYIMISQFWIFDSRHPRFIIKQKDTNYIQTWHGTPLKKLALDMDSLSMGGETDIENYKRLFKLNTQNWDFLISQNKYSSEIFRRAFDFRNRIIEIGYPRNDRLVMKYDTDQKNALKQKYGLPLEKKIILYAPTWRDNEFYSKMKYEMNLRINIDLFSEELGEEAVFIIKSHYLISKNILINNETNNSVLLLNSSSVDIQELFIVSDILITDYSSVMFDFSILGKPMIFYVYDYEFYRDQLRGLYFDIVDEVPGPIVFNDIDLIDQIKKIISSSSTYYIEYNEKYKSFVEKYNHADDGTAAIKIVELIEMLN